MKSNLAKVLVNTALPRDPVRVCNPDEKITLLKEIILGMGESSY